MNPVTVDDPCSCLPSGLVCYPCSMANTRIAAVAKHGNELYVQSVLTAVAEKHHLLPEHILSRSAIKHVSAARRDAAKKLRADGMSYRRIGHVLRRDQSQIQYLVKGRKRVVAP